MAPSTPRAASLLEQPHHDGAALHVPEDAPALGATVPVFLRVPRDDGLTGAWARLTPDAEPHLLAGRIDRETATETWWRFDIVVHNPLTGYRFLLGGGPRGYRWLNGGGVHGHDVTDADDFRLTTAPPPPAWARDAVVYQIFLDRFARSAAADGRPRPPWARPAGWDEPVAGGRDAWRRLYGGDLDGIIEHLDHLAALGVNALYLTPFFPAESNHRYNASSFEEVDPVLGGDKALARLSREVHARGWHLVGDLTANHCGDTHGWFRRALEDPQSTEREFFYFPGPHDNRYESWLGHSTLPKLRYHSAELRRRLLLGPGSVAGRWLRPPFELDGWRVDVANMTGRHAGDDFNAEVAAALRATMDDVRPDTLLLAEHCHDATADLGRGGWQGTMNYAGFTYPVWAWLRHPDVHLPFGGLPLEVPRLGGEALFAAVRAFLAAAPWRSSVTSWWLLGSHDSSRIRSVVRQADLGEVAAGLLFTMPGTPMVFAGDEIGVDGVGDPGARRPFPWHRSQEWDRTTLDHYRELAALRRASHALRRGGLRWAHVEGDALVFLRESERQRLLVLAARAGHPPIRLPAAPLGLAGEAPNRYGAAPPLEPAPDGSVTLPGDGPTFQVWQLA
jgi:alpha-glucosidase